MVIRPNWQSFAGSWQLAAGFLCFLTPAEIEVLGHDMGLSIEWAQAELKRRRVVELSGSSHITYD
jgi:hypothetical protein